MPPQVPILAQSENKSKFLERLNISDQSEEGKRVYAMMKEEAVAGRARMSENPTSLIPQLANDTSVRPPYSNTQISETAMHRETLNIYHTARPETKVYYNLGHYVDGGTEENWIIKWLLWHVFRYRDNRNRGRTMPQWIARGSQGAVLDTSGVASVSTAITATDQSTSREQMEFWKASRLLISIAAIQSHDSPSRQSSAHGFYDPVRDSHRTH